MGLMGPYMLKGKDKPVIDFMCLTVIDPVISWFEMVELPLMIIEKHVGKFIETSKIFDKTAKQVARLVNQLWFSGYPKKKS